MRDLHKIWIVMILLAIILLVVIDSASAKNTLSLSPHSETASLWASDSDFTRQSAFDNARAGLGYTCVTSFSKMYVEHDYKNYCGGDCPRNLVDIFRGFLLVDTSIIPDTAEIEALSISITGLNAYTHESNLAIFEGTFGTTVTTADWNQFSTNYLNQTMVDGTNEIILPQTAIDNVSKTAYSHYVFLQRNRDYNNIAPVYETTYGMIGGTWKLIITYNTTTDPIMVSSVILPSVASKSHNLIGQCKASHADGDPISFNYNWFKGGSFDRSGEIASQAESTTVNVSTIPYNDTTIGDVWILECEPNDGDELGNATNSTSKIIIDSPSVFSESNFSTTLSHGGNFSVQLNASDIDGDSINWIINTSIFDVNQTGYVNKTLNISHTGIYNFTVWANSSGGNSSSWLWVNVTNTAPVAASATISQEVADTAHNVTLNYTESDFDYDLISCSIAWFVNGGFNSTFSNLTIIDYSHLVLGQNWTANVSCNDSLNQGAWDVSNTLNIGDDVAPVFSDDSLSASSGNNDAPFSIYVTVTELNSITYVRVEITDPNSIATNFSMVEQPLDVWKKTYTPSTDGVYSFKFYAKDGSNNVGELDSNLTYTEQTENTPAGGGGGGSTIVIEADKEECSLILSEIHISLSSKNSLEEIIIRNEDVISYSPLFQIVSISGNLSDAIEITNIVPTILPGKEGSFGVRYDVSSLAEGEANIILSSSNCNDITLVVTSGKIVDIAGIFDNLADGKFEIFFQESIFETGSTFDLMFPFLSIGITFILITMLVSGSMFGTIVKSMKRGNFVLTLILLIVDIGLSMFILVMAVAILKGG